jgi:Tfp pilus assembly protein PilN
MRPVNLIPPDARRGDRAPMRVGSTSYVVIGALALALLGAIALAFTSKQVSERESEQAQLEQDLQAATERAQSLQAFASFRAVQETRAATVSSLAQSRFDWERVLNELALVIPGDVWLTELTGTVSPAVQVEGGTDVALRGSVPGPALSVVGCATGQDAVAGFVADLEDIDGVTRVGVASSERSEEDPAEQGGGGPAPTTDSGSEGGGECRTRDFISKFQIVVAFDQVPVPETATTAPSVPAPVTPPSSDGDQGQLAGAGSGAEASSSESSAATPSSASPSPGGGG